MAKRILLALSLGLALSFAGLSIAQAQVPDTGIEAPPQGPATTPPPTATQRADDARVRALLAQMVTALGGDKWLNLPGFETNGRTAGFYKGRPTGATSLFVAYHAYPDKDCTILGKKHDVEEIIVGDTGWEVTYKGKAPIPQKDLDDAIRRRDHSIEIAVRQWLKDPNTLLVNGGETTVERHLVDRVTLISSTNDNITIDMDEQTHLPIRRSFQWRDPLYKDENVDAEEYDLYHNINGILTPFSVTRIHNDDTVSQRFLFDATYGGPVPPATFDPDAAMARLDPKGAKKGK